MKTDNRPTLLLICHRAAEASALRGFSHAVWLLVFIAFHLYPPTTSAQPRPAKSCTGQTLEAGATVQREISAQQRLPYTVSANRGDFVLLSISPTNLDGPPLVISLADPKGTVLWSEQDKYGQWETTEVPFIATASGTWCVEIQAPQQHHPKRFALTLTIHSPATASESQIASAYRALWDAIELSNRGDNHSLEQAAHLLDSARSKFVALSNDTMTVAVLHYLGSLSEKRFDFDKAGKYYNSALKLLAHKQHSLWNAVLLKDLADVASESGDPLESVEKYRRSADSFHILHLTILEAEALNNLGLEYQALGEYTEPMSLYSQALSLLAEENDDQLEGVIFNNIGLLYTVQNKPLQAIPYLQRALPLRADPRNQDGEAQTLSNLADAYSQAKRPQDALKQYQLALQANSGSADAAQRILILNNMASTFKDLGDEQNQMVYLHKALDLSLETKLNGAEAFVRASLAAAELKQSDLAQALTDISKTVEIDEARRNSLTSSDMSMTSFAQSIDDYKLQINVLMALHTLHPDSTFDERAFAASESSKARRLLDSITFGVTDTNISVDSKLLARQQTLENRLRASVDQNHISSSTGYPEVSQRGLALNTLILQYRAVSAAINSARGFNNSLHQSRARDRAAIQSKALDPDTILLEYSLGDDHSYLWLLSNREFVTTTLPPRREIEALAANVYGLLHNSAGRTLQGDGSKQDNDLFLSYANRLSSIVIGPVANKLHDARLVIVADGILQYVPFAALPIPEDDAGTPANRYTPLITQHEIVYLPSASSLDELRLKAVGCRHARHTVALVADPVFSTADSRYKPNTTTSTPPSGHPQERMYFTAQEGASILSQTDDSTSFVATGFNATRSTIENARLGDYRLLHFATHTFIDDVYPELSRIELTAVDPDGRYRDPYLYSFDLPHLDLPRDLIVLSSCETGIGKGVDGEGLISLTYSLMAGGTKRIVASLWAVNGESTAVLMERFYRGLLADRLSPAEALRQAQISMWKDERWTSPSNWGAFVFAGDWQGWTLDTEELRRSELNGTVLASVLEDSKSAGTYEILPRDVAPDAELYSFLDGPKPISDYVFSRLSQPALHLIGERDREKFRASLAQELNRILADDNVYSDDRFKGVALSEQARQLIATKPQGSEIVELNRMLMEEAFPSIISRRIIPRNDVMPGPPAPKYSWYGETTCLEEVDSSRSDIQTKLRDLETHPLYDCGSQIGLLKDLQGRCRYVRALDFRAKSFNSEVEATPASWGKLLANDKVSEMWIEDSVRVDADGNPIAQPDDWTRPVAVLSDKALYLVREQEDDSRERLVGAGGIKLREKRFSLGDAKDPRSTVSKVMNVFVADFQATFSSPPFNGNIANDPFLDKGELEMRSIDRPSLILGEPFIEDAAYVVNWWASDGEFVTFYTYGCTKGQKSCTGHDIYVDIDWSLLIRSSNTQPYRPPTPTQMAKYKEQIDKSLVLAVSKACQELNGKITDGVCKVP